MRPASTLALLASAAAAGVAPAQVRTIGAAEFAPVADRATVLEVLSAARLALTADLSEVVVLKLGDGPPLALQIDARAMIRTGNTTSNVQLDELDVVFVPTGAESAEDPIAAAIDATLRAAGDQDRTAVLCLRAGFATDAFDRSCALRELCEVESPAEWVIDTVRARLTDRDLCVVREAVTTLGVLAAHAASDALRALVDHDDAQVRARARAALGLTRIVERRSTR